MNAPLQGSSNGVVYQQVQVQQHGQQVQYQQQGQQQEQFVILPNGQKAMVMQQPPPPHSNHGIPVTSSATYVPQQQVAQATVIQSQVQVVQPQISYGTTPNDVNIEMEETRSPPPPPAYGTNE